MKENILHVLMYLFTNHADNPAIPIQSQQNLIKELELAGFNLDDVEQALDWLDDIADYALIKNDQSISSPKKISTFRILTPEEEAHIDTDCWGYPLFLEQANIVDSNVREIILHHLLRFDPEVVDVPLVKWITLIVLSAQPGKQDALHALEKLVLEGASAEIMQ